MDISTHQHASLLSSKHVVHVVDWLGTIPGRGQVVLDGWQVSEPLHELLHLGEVVQAVVGQNQVLCQELIHEEVGHGHLLQ